MPKTGKHTRSKRSNMSRKTQKKGGFIFQTAKGTLKKKITNHDKLLQLCDRAFNSTKCKKEMRPKLMSAKDDIYAFYAKNKGNNAVYALMNDWKKSQGNHNDVRNVAEVHSAASRRVWTEEADAMQRDKQNKRLEHSKKPTPRKSHVSRPYFTHYDLPVKHHTTHYDSTKNVVEGYDTRSGKLRHEHEKRSKMEEMKRLEAEALQNSQLRQRRAMQFERERLQAHHM